MAARARPLLALAACALLLAALAGAIFAVQRAFEADERLLERYAQASADARPAPTQMPQELAAARTRRRAALALLLAVSLAAIAGAVAVGVYAQRRFAAQRARLADLEQLAHEDALTGLLNRRRLNEMLPVELARARRLGYPLTVAMLDLDHFKRFNDKRGHAAGDALLRDAAAAWRRQLRPTDLLARYGGEEFTLVLPACDALQAAQMIERLRPLTPQRQTFSAGVATWNGEDGADELLRAADLALLAAKRSGRNRTVIAGAEPQIPLPLRAA